MFLVLLLTNDSFGQKNDSLNTVKIIAGVGNYEYLYAGLNIPILKTSYTEFAIGIKPWNFSSEFYAMMYFDVGLPLFETGKHHLLRAYLQPKAVTWYFNNEYNRFVFIALGGEIRLTYSLNRKIDLSASAGALYNLELHYERKTYEEVGYPKELQPSFSVQLAFPL